MKLYDRIFGSPVGAKMLMALSGLMLTGFVLAHLSGNLLLYAGQEKFNAYAHGLQSLGLLLWLARGGLLTVFVLHLYLAIKLTIENKAARPVPYAHEATIQATLASRYMVHTGLLMLAFVVYHLAHFTFKVTCAEMDALLPGDAYSMVVLGFSNPAVSGFYILAMAALATHLRHGVSSAFQSFGLYHGNLNMVTDKLGPLVAAIVFLGFSSIPVSVLLGCIK